MTTLAAKPRKFAPPPLSSIEDLARRGIAFEPVVFGEPASPVRLRHHGVCYGVFPRREDAGPSIRLLTR